MKAKKLEAQQARKELDEIETIFKIEADGTLKGYAEAMYNTLESLRNSRNAIVQEILKLDKGLASFKTLESRFNGGEFYNFLQDIISLREKADMSLYEKEKARKRIEEALNINPIKEFGTNYAEHYHSGESAIAKLINEAQAHKESGAKGEYKGQVAGAFHRKELGDIDLVWGQVEGKGKEAKGYGLAKIIEKHGDEFKDIAKEIDNIIQDGEVVKRQGRDEAYNIEYNGFKVGINKGFNKQGENKWIVTAFDDNIEKTAKTAPANDFTKGASLPLNSKDIIPQQTPKETQDSTAQILENFKKEFNIHDKAFKPTGHIRDNTKTGELEVLDTLNEYRPILNKNTYKKDGYYVISNHHNDLELLDFNGFNLGKVYHKKYDGKHRLFNIQDLELLENVSKDFLLLNGNKTLEQARKLAQSKTKKGVYIDYFNEIQDPIKSINKATTKDGVEIYTLNTQKFKQKEPLTNLTADLKQLSQRTSQETKEIMLNHILENHRLLYLLKQGINTQHLSPFQKEVLESVLDIANNPTKYKAYKLQGLQKQLNILNESEAYLKTLGNYDKARYAKDREELEREIAALKGETSLESATQKADSNDIIFTDKKGKEHTLTKEVQQQWLDTFNLKSLDESYIPKHSDEILQALGGKEIKLQLGSLKKLVAQGREKYIPQIKEVLDSPEAILKDSDNAFLFIKHLKDDDYFVNVSVDKGEYLVSISNGIKETNNIKNKLDFGAKVIYQSPNANSNLQTLLQDLQYSANKIDSAIIPQNPTKAQSEYFNPFMNEYEKIKEIKKLHTQDDNLIRVMKVQGRNDYIEPLSNMSVSKEYLQKQTTQSLKENITQAILDNQTQLKALQQGYNTYHLSPFQKEILESALDTANNPTKLKEYKLQGLQKQLNNLNSNEAYHIEKGREYDKARYAKDREELEKEIYALKGESNDIIATESNKENTYILREQTKEILNSLVGKNITNQNDGRIAQISRKNIAKMTSDKAVGKSVANGFSEADHFKACARYRKLVSRGSFERNA